MQTDSETESETESSNNWNTRARSPTYASTPPKRPCVPHTNVLLAIEEIKQVDLSAIDHDDSLHDGVFAASNCIIEFLSNVCTLPLLNSFAPRVLTLYPHLVNADFLDVLFDHRQLFYSIGVRSTPHNVSSSATIVSWVDVLLAKLGDFILTVASGSCPQLRSSTSGYLQNQREEDGIRAATQLPEKWRSLTNMITSNQASPAAKRLALRLLFAAYVMGPQLNKQPSHIGLDIQPQEILDSLFHSNQGFLNGFRAILDKSYCDEQERVNFAMIICLFSIAQRRLTESQSPMRPQALGCLLNMIGFVLNEHLSFVISECIMPLLELDIPQVILLRWGNVVPWCWSTWNDPRIANTENITQLTVTWLYHMDRPFWPLEINNFSGFTASLASQLSNCGASSCPILVRILHQIAIVLQDTTDTQRPGTLTALGKVLCRACWATTQLLIVYTQGVEPEIQQYIPELCCCLLGLFCVLDASEEELQIKDLVLEALTLVRPSILGVCLTRTQENSNFQFNLLIDEAIVKATRKLYSPHEAPATGCDHLAAKSIISFLTIIWHTNTQNCIFQGAGPLLGIIVTFLQKHPAESQVSSMHCDTLLVALSVLSTERVSKVCLGSIHEEYLWVLAMRAGRSNLTIASGFAHRLIVTDQTVDTIRYAEAWDYLRDIFLLVLGRRVPEQEEALALLICPAICLALVKLIRCDFSTTIHILSSPWTTSLCTQLRSVIDAHGNSNISYFTTLHQRLGRVGKLLMDQITARKSNRIPDIPISRFTTQLIFCHTYPNSRLVLVPQVVGEI